MASVSGFRSWTYRPLTVVEKFQNLLSCLKFIRYLTFLMMTFQGAIFKKLIFGKNGLGGAD